MTRALVALLLATPALNGCIAAAAPLVAAGAIGKHRLDKRDEDLPASTDMTRAVPIDLNARPTGQVVGAPSPVSSAPATPAPSTPMPVPATASGSVPPGMQYLYGSGEAAAISIQAYLGLTDFVLAKASDFAVGHPVNSVVLAPGATIDAPKFVDCKPGQRLALVLDIDETALMNLGYEADDSQRSGPYDQSRWDRWEVSGAGAVEPVPGAYGAIRAARQAGVTVVFNSNRSAANAGATAAALTNAGLGPVVHGDTLWLKGDAGSAVSGKDARRWAIAARYCVIAMVGDQLGDFSDLFNAPGMTPVQRRQATAMPLVRMLWGHGWFVLPNPVYGTGLKGNIDEVFPKDRRWTDPGTAAGVAPAQPPMPASSPVATAGTPK